MTEWGIEERIHSMTSRLYDAALNPADWPSVLDDMAALCGGMGVTIFPMRAASETFTYVSPSVAEAAATYFNDWIHRCPRIAYDAVNPIINRCFWDGDILDDDTLRTDPYFRDYGRGYDLQYSVVRTTSALSSGVRHVLSSPYSLKTGKPSDTDIRHFEILSAHATRAIAIHQSVGAASDATDGMARLFDNRACGILLVDPAGYVTRMNATAEALCGDGLVLKGRRLYSSHPSQQAALGHALSAARHPDPLRPLAPLALRRSPGRRPLILQATPASGSKARFGSAESNGTGAILITLTDPDAAPPRSGCEAFVLLGLSPAEARVASILGSGASPENAAEELGLAIGTIRNHLKSIFAKLDIARQSQLVALAMRLADIDVRQ